MVLVQKLLPLSKLFKIEYKQIRHRNIDCCCVGVKKKANGPTIHEMWPPDLELVALCLLVRGVLDLHALCHVALALLHGLAVNIRVRGPVAAPRALRVSTRPD